MKTNVLPFSVYLCSVRRRVSGLQGRGRFMRYFGPGGPHKPRQRLELACSLHTWTWWLLEQGATCSQIVRDRNIPRSPHSLTPSGNRSSCRALWLRCHQTLHSAISLFPSVFTAPVLLLCYFPQSPGPLWTFIQIAWPFLQPFFLDPERNLPLGKTHFPVTLVKSLSLCFKLALPPPALRCWAGTPQTVPASLLQSCSAGLYREGHWGDAPLRRVKGLAAAYGFRSICSLFPSFI